MARKRAYKPVYWSPQDQRGLWWDDASYAAYQASDPMGDAWEVIQRRSRISQLRTLAFLRRPKPIDTTEESPF